MRDYIVAVDENGQPYLAHAGEGFSQTGSGGTTGRRRANSKYIMKIQTRYGNRYFYTPQEVQAYQQAKNGIKNAAQKVDQARRTLKSDLNKRKTMKEAQKEAATSLKDVEHLTGRWYKARIETPAEAAYDKKFAEATKKTYDKTKLGKAENAAKEAVSSAVNNVKSKSDRMKDEFRKNKEKVKDKLDDVQDTVKEVTGYGAKERLGTSNLIRAREEAREARKRQDAADIRTRIAQENAAMYDAHAKSTLFGKKKAQEVADEAQDKYDKAKGALERAEANSARAQEVYDNLSKDAKKYDSSIAKKIDDAKSKADKMKDEFRKKKENVKDKLGVDEKKRVEKTREEVKDTNERLEKAQRELDISDDDVNKLFNKDSVYANKRWEELNRGEKAHAEDAFDRNSEKFHARNKAEDEARRARIANKKAEEEYDETPLGKAENVKDAAKDVKDKAVESVNKAKDKVDEVAFSSKRSKYSEYKENDPDFDDKNYDEKNRVGDTDFFSFKGKDGRTVIVEEDMKWTLPKGVDPNSPEIHAALKKFASQVESAREMNNSAYTGQEWRDAVTEAIDDASREALKKK